MQIDDETFQAISETREKYEFMSFLVFDKDIVVGIVQNETPKMLMIYQYDMIRSTEEKELFLHYGDEWWWGSNHSIPINLFIGDRFEQFESCLRGYPRKSICDIIGPTFSLADRYLRRVRKKKIEIIIPPKEKTLEP